jgi:hypothetical protein
MTSRVQIPAYTDRWAMGDRYGRVVATLRGADGSLMLIVLLDKSGKTVKVAASDCTEVVS